MNTPLFSRYKKNGFKFVVVFAMPVTVYTVLGREMHCFAASPLFFTLIFDGCVVAISECRL